MSSVVRQLRSDGFDLQTDADRELVIRSLVRAVEDRLLSMKRSEEIERAVMRELVRYQDARVTPHILHLVEFAVLTRFPPVFVPMTSG